MGTDCRISTVCGGHGLDLDRWYCFSDDFKTGESVPKADCLARLEERYANSAPKHDLEYQKNWVKRALTFVEKTPGDAFVFYAEYDPKY